MSIIKQRRLCGRYQATTVSGKEVNIVIGLSGTDTVRVRVFETYRATSEPPYYDEVLTCDGAEVMLDKFIVHHYSQSLTQPIEKVEEIIEDVDPNAFSFGNWLEG